MQENFIEGNEENNTDDNMEEYEEVEVNNNIYQDETPKKKAGRPKGSTVKAKMEQLLNDKTFDIFDYAMEYVKKANESIKFRISQGGDYIGDALLETGAPHERGKIYLQSWDDLRSRFGAGVFTVILYSINRRCVIRQQTMKLAPLPEANSIWDTLKDTYSDNQQMPQQNEESIEGINQKLDDKIIINMPKQKSFAENLKDVMPILAPLIPIVVEYFKNNKKIDPYEEQRRIDDKIDRERQRMIDEQERFERKARELLEEKLANYIPPKETSLIDRLGNIAETVATTMLQNPNAAKVLTGANVNQQRSVETRLALPPAAPSVPEIDPEREKELLVNFTQKKILGGFSMEQLAEFINKNTKIKNRFLKYNKDILVEKAKSMVDLDQGTWGIIEENLNKLYVFILGEQTVTTGGSEEESKKAEVLQVQA